MKRTSETGSINITSEILQFKEAVRNIWNSYFLDYAESDYVTAFNNFEKIETSLFWAMVVCPLGLNLEVSNFRKKSFNQIQVVVKNDYPEFVAQLGKADLHNNIVWSVSSLFQSNQNLILHFCDFFDWNPYGFVDYSHIRCSIENFPDDETYNQGYCLLETRYVDFIYANK